MDKASVGTPVKAPPTSGLFGSFKQVENVILCRRGESLEGTLYLAEHHIVFSWRVAETESQKPRQRQVWITYPMISRATLRISATPRQRSAIRLRCRDFTFVALQFAQENQACETFDKIKALTCDLGTIEMLLAFAYRPPPEEEACDGWALYNARDEYRRMGIGPKESEKGWRISTINHDYEYSPTYPSTIVVPSSVSDNVLKYGGPYRSRCRIPALSYLHSVNNCSITRSSQPMVGLFKGKRNIQDEKLVAAIFATSQSHTHGIEDAWEGAPDSPHASLDAANADDVHRLAATAEAPETSLHTSHSEPNVRSATKVYGAQQRNLIIDARPVLNARANQATGKGSENMEHYKDATINFLGIDNVHVMRDSLNKVIEALSHTDYTKLPPDQDTLTRSKWLKYIRLLLRGTDLVARQVGINHSHVLIHCSDGWDRTSQISALSQLCLDPYYRTLKGFIVLVEKDWLSFGHMFRRRAGHLSSEKWFDIEDDRPKTHESSPRGANAGNNAFGTAILNAKDFFLKRAEHEGVDGSEESDPPTPARNELHRTHTDDISPIFHQFLDATWQLLRQHPTRFEFNERFLRRLLYHLYACQYGTFLFDSELERAQAHARTRTRSVWDYFLARKEQFLNPAFGPAVDDKVPGQERLLFPDCNRVRWWAESFGRGDEEMNGTPGAPAQSLPRDEPELITGIESADVVAGTAATAVEDNDPFAGARDRVIKSLSSISLGASFGAAKSSPVSRTGTPSHAGAIAREEERRSGPGSPVPNAMSAQAFARDSAFRDL